VTVTVRPPVPDPSARLAGRSATAKKRSWRWLRLVLPIAIALLILAASAIAYSFQQPDQADPGYLSPVGTGSTGGSRLADALRAKGVNIQRVTKTSDALVAADAGDVTLLLPAPGFSHPFYLRMLKLLPSSVSVVLVDPSQRTLANGLQPLDIDERHLSAHLAALDCRLDGVPAGTAAEVQRAVYSDVDPETGVEIDRCYGGGLVTYVLGQAQVTVVGAADPFRNDRIGEHANQAFAAGLLSVKKKVVWLDLHHSEPRPGYVDDPALASGTPAPPSLGPGSPDPDFPIPGSDEPTIANPHFGGGGDGGGGSPPNPLFQAFPPWLFATAALLAVGMVLLALARARRLGVPVPEPLPVLVRSTETVEGRGRLYQRAKARPQTLRALQAVARDRLARLLDLGANPDRTVLVDAVAAQSGWPREDVDRTLYQGDPEKDEDLVRAALLLETLTHPTPHDTIEGDPR